MAKTKKEINIQSLKFIVSELPRKKRLMLEPHIKNLADLLGLPIETLVGPKREGGRPSTYCLLFEREGSQALMTYFTAASLLGMKESTLRVNVSRDQGIFHKRQFTGDWGERSINVKVTKIDITDPQYHHIDKYELPEGWLKENKYNHIQTYQQAKKIKDPVEREEALAAVQKRVEQAGRY